MYMTINQAVAVQNAQLNYYRNVLGRKGVKEFQKIARESLTPDCPNPTKDIFVGEINKYIPRGFAFENILRQINRRPRQQESIDIILAWHNAIRNGKTYH